LQTQYNTWVAIQPAYDTTSGGTGGGADNWGTQTVVTDNTLTGLGTTGSPLKADTTKLATQNFVNNQTVSFSSSTVNGFDGNGTTTPITTKANVTSIESTTTDGQLVVYNSTNGKQIKKYTGSGFIKMTSGVPVSQSTINLSSEVSGLLNISNINATGTPSSTTYLRGDGTWATASGSGGMADPGANGIMVRSALNTSIARSIAVGTDLSVSNADGVSGNPTISLGSNVPRLNATQTWTGTNNFSTISTGAATFSQTAWDNANLAVFASGGQNTTGSNFQFGSSSSVHSRITSRGSTAASLAANASYSNFIIGINNINEASSGTHPWLTGMVIKNPFVIGAAASVGNTANLYLESGNFATVTGRNYSLYAEGRGRFADLQISSLGAGVVTSNSSGDLSSSSVLPINLGGTNASTANAALNNLLPAQVGSAGSALVTDGTNTSWSQHPGWSVLTGTTTSTSLTSIGTINIPTGTTGIIEMRIIAKHVIDINQVERMQIVRNYAFSKNGNGLFSYTTSVEDPLLATQPLTYTPTFSPATLSNNLDIRVASDATESTSWTVYYKIWYDIDNL
jgi:hypothetical protein